METTEIPKRGRTANLIPKREKKSWIQMRYLTNRTEEKEIPTLLSEDGQLSKNFPSHSIITESTILATESSGTPIQISTIGDEVHLNYAAVKVV
jgi:hypothetical protein